MQSFDIAETPLIQTSNQTALENREEESDEEPLNERNTSYFVLTIFTIVGSLISQTIMLSEGKYFKTKPEDAGTILSIGLIIQLATYLALSKPYIEMSRKYGVRNLILYGAITYMIGCLCPMSEAPVLSNFFFCQFLFGNAFTALLSVPWKSADTSDLTKTKASGNLAWNIFPITQLAPDLKFIFTFYGVSWPASQIYASAVPFFGFMIASVFMENGNRRYNPRRDKEAKNLIKTHKWLLILVVLRGALIIFFGGMFTFTTLHYYSSLIATNMGYSDLSIRCWSHMVISVPVLCSWLYARFLDKDNKSLIINLSVFACVSSAIFWFVIPIVGYESNSLATLAGLISGIGGSGIFMISDNIHRRFFSESEQKIVREYLRTVQLVPIMILVLICGLIYDYWARDAAFYLLSLILMLCGLVMKKISTILRIAEKVR